MFGVRKGISSLKSYQSRDWNTKQSLDPSDPVKFSDRFQDGTQVFRSDDDISVYFIVLLDEAWVISG